MKKNEAGFVIEHQGVRYLLKSKRCKKIDHYALILSYLISPYVLFLIFKEAFLAGSPGLVMGFTLFGSAFFVFMMYAVYVRIAYNDHFYYEKHEWEEYGLVE